MRDITIQLVTWNSAAALRESLPLLQKIDPAIAAVRVIDNASRDESVALVKQYLPHAEVVQLTTNNGFAEGHNEGFKRCTTPYVLVLNPDTKLHWEGVRAALDYFKNERVGAIQGKLYRGEDKIIDSVGVMLTRAFNGRERGAGEMDHGQYDEVALVDAVTGACALYRLAALWQVAQAGHEIFDVDFFAYKEDVDLGWRLRRAGWKIVYIPETMGVHGRSLKTEGPLGWKVSSESLRRRLRDPRTRYSIRSWVWMVIKNASGVELLTHAPWLVGRLLIFILLTLFYWPLMRVWVEVGRGIPRMIAKRRTYS